MPRLRDPHINADDALAEYEEYYKREVATLEAEKPRDLLNYLPTDEGNANRIRDAYGESLRFVIEDSSWLQWNGYRWVAGQATIVWSLFSGLMQQARKQYAELPPPPDDDKEAVKQHKQLGAFLLNSTNAKPIQNAILSFQNIPDVRVSASQMNAGMMSIGTPSGAIDLLTGRATIANMSLYVTKSLAVDYDPNATCPRWLQFLEEITPGHPELISYLQRCVGYSLTGSVKEECLFFLSGTGANGKGTFVETITQLMGDYGIVAPKSMFARELQTMGSDDYHAASLFGMRFAAAAELEEGSYWDEAKIKALTGGDSVTGRHPYGRPFSFVPQHTLWVSGNRRPAVKGTDNGIWRRLKLIRFTANFPEDSGRDGNLKTILLTELPGILRWAVQGCLDWQDQGLNHPKCVTDWTREYREEEDVLGLFIKERLESDSMSSVALAVVYDEYTDWMEQEGSIKFALTRRSIGKKLRELGFNVVHSRAGKMVDGWRIKAQSSAEPISNDYGF